MKHSQEEIIEMMPFLISTIDDWVVKDKNGNKVLSSDYYTWIDQIGLDLYKYGGGWDVINAIHGLNQPRNQYLDQILNLIEHVFQTKFGAESIKDDNSIRYIETIVVGLKETMQIYQKGNPYQSKDNEEV